MQRKDFVAGNHPPNALDHQNLANRTALQVQLHKGSSDRAGGGSSRFHCAESYDGQITKSMNDDVGPALGQASRILAKGSKRRSTTGGPTPNRQRRAPHRSAAK